MRILLLSPALASGGVETGTIDLAKSLKDVGEGVVVVSSGGPLVAELEKQGVKHIELPVHKKSLLTLFQVSKLSQIIKTEHIDIVHAQSRVPAWIAYFACRNTRVPFVTSCHGYYSKHLFSSVMAKGERVMVISSIIAKHMQENFKVPQEKIRLVYRGVDLSRYHFQENKYKTPKDKFIIVNISRITPIKGQREFIKAVHLVAKEEPNIEAWLVGSAEEQKKAYEVNLYKLVKELNLGDQVKFLGRRTDIPEILREADLLVLSTQVLEAFGRVLIEAGASGVAVCATRTGGITEVIKDKEDGILFDLGDNQSMAQAIKTLIADTDLRQRCANSLYRKVQEKFSLERMSKNTLDVYKEVVAQKRILVIKLGGLGDLILAMPSLKMLRNQFPLAKISLLTDKSLEPIVRSCPYIDGLILFRRKDESLSKLIKDLRQKKFGVSIDFKNNSLTHFIAYQAKIPLRYGFSKGLTGFLLNRPEPLPRDLDEQPVKQQFRILNKAGVELFFDQLELWPNAVDNEYVDKALQEKGVLKQDKLIGLAIGASPQWPTKDWPVENFSKLTQMLIEKNLKVVLLGAEHSIKRVEKFPQHKNLLSFVGQTDLGQLISLITRLDVLVSGDSAPMHIASAVETSSIVLFGPTSPMRHLPPGGKAKALVKKIACQPCYKRRCINKQQLECLNKISVKEVFDLILKKIR